MMTASRFADAIRMRTTDGWELFLSTHLAPEVSLNALGLLLDGPIPKERMKDLQYIDLRIENRIFYRYQDGSGTTVVPAIPDQQTDIKEKKKE
jgi:hypothetical protein